MAQSGEERYGGAGGHGGDTTDQGRTWVWLENILGIVYKYLGRTHCWTCNAASYKSFITKKQNIQGKSVIFMRNIIINIGIFICKKS